MSIQQTPLGDQVYSIIWNQIASRKLRPGDKISDLRLSQELGISRTPVREALHRLTQDGIVRNESRRGFFIPTFSSEDIHEVYGIRCALEVLAVRLALPSLTRQQLDQEMWNLAQARQKVEEADADARDYWLKVDRGFHQLLVDAAQNRRLAGLIAGLQAQIAVFQVFGTHFRPINLLFPRSPPGDPRRTDRSGGPGRRAGDGAAYSGSQGLDVGRAGQPKRRYLALCNH